MYYYLKGRNYNINYLNNALEIIVGKKKEEILKRHSFFALAGTLFLTV